MIHVTTKCDEAGLCGLRVTGHSDYAEAGSDIICAAVSTLITTCANALQAVAGVTPLISDEPDVPRLRVSLPKNLDPAKRHDAQIIMDSTLLGLQSVAESQPKYLQIN